VDLLNCYFDFSLAQIGTQGTKSGGSEVNDNTFGSWTITGTVINLFDYDGFTSGRIGNAKKMPKLAGAAGTCKRGFVVGPARCGQAGMITLSGTTGTGIIGGKT